MNESARLEILEMLASQKTSAQEAADMLRALESADEATALPKAKGGGDETVYKSEALPEDAIRIDEEIVTWKDSAVVHSDDRPRWLKIRVRDMHSDRDKVTVNVPMWLVSFGLGAARRVGADLGGYDPAMLQDLVKEGRKGILVDVQDEEDGEHVQIYLD